MAEASIRSVGVTAKINGQTIQVVDLEVLNRVGSLATIRVTGHNADDAKATQSSSKISLSKFAAQAGDLQTYILTTARLKPDFLVSASDGQGGTMDFSGYLSAPAFSIGYGSADLSYSGVHEAAILGFYHGEVFVDAGFGTDYEKSIEEVFDPASLAWPRFTGSVTDLMLRQIEQATKTLNELGPQGINDNSVSRAINFSMQSENALVLPQVQAFLAGSRATSTIPGITGLGPDLDVALRNHLWTAITSEGGLLSVLLNVIPVEYGMQFVCALSGAPSSRLELLSYVNAQPTPITIPAENFAFTSGGEFALPIKAVVVRGAKNVDVYTTPGAADEANQFASAVASFPSDAEITPGARVVVRDAPTWFNSGNFALLLDPDTYAGPGDIRAYQARHPKLKELIANVNDDAQRLLEWWAKTQFAYLSLASAQATARIPLNLGIEAGRVYEISVLDSTGSASQLFQGYVEGVSHRISSREGGLDASTTISFTHVQAKGYVQAGDRPTL
jgi:hypothetical protein